ncbi:(2Fe-2S)-binding protein [Metallumcola ferriviriculae]|uniref:(2Fe-2S)-binding protein n=1 Tax=Metallumcola ferriviriculae TaxID=3039180 RepID=A0AAU0US42_9FIRM|nr:(2Fe-2S)-binding protein [Desulfitibacteraceae bacterium MK1]
MAPKKLICRCEEITEEEVLTAIADGAETVDGVKRRTRAGMGLCQGRTCGRLILTIIAKETGQSPANLIPHTSRPPVRTLPLSIVKEEGDLD